MKAVLCPVCNGKGTTKSIDPTETSEYKCHGCGGKGWVEVSEALPLFEKQVECPN